jgi:hypothetical protein
VIHLGGVRNSHMRMGDVVSRSRVLRGIGGGGGRIMAGQQYLVLASRHAASHIGQLRLRTMYSYAAACVLSNALSHECLYKHRRCSSRPSLQKLVAAQVTPGSTIKKLASACVRSLC